MEQKKLKRDATTSKQGRTRNLLVRFVQLRTGKSIQQLANEMGIYYHSLIKTLWKKPNRQRHRAALALKLGVPYDDLWGSDSKLEELIDEEINKVVIRYALSQSIQIRSKIPNFQGN